MDANKDKYKAVRYEHFGHVDVLHIVELPKPAANKGEVLIRVKAAGINPGEASIREGFLEKQFPSTFPSGQGTDFAGVIESVGADITAFKPGDKVIGFSNNRNSQAEYVVVKPDQLVSKPPKVSWEQAGGLFVAGTTAYAAVRAVGLKEGDIVIVSGAAGGVGSLAVQIAKKRGAKVIGIASAPNHHWLKKHDVIPVSYDGNIEESLKIALSGSKADAFIDTSGKGYVELAIKLGISVDRINTIIDFAAVEKYKIKAEGSAAASTAQVLGELAQMVNDGGLEIPIAKTYPLSLVKDAYIELEKHHTHGKIVLIP
ncbi:NADP-dependent oxidoreductase [Mucilaginibacter sp. L196]|uniref:NADP-dependent oxidoreductase n=1 Tax=Mucilaginibacter sp. L196 TaxID=1641870 RepID=UPI00131A727F|nr:NADP-dependent oxidoreductase [Mucilaginibacter sp. L196]